MPRILLAQLFHESNGFVAGTTPLSAFTLRRGRAMLACRGDGTVLDGMLAAADERGWEVVPALALSCPPSAPAADAVLAAFLGGLDQALAQGGAFAGAVLAMHGAMLCAGSHDPEGEAAAHLRAHPALRGAPLVAACDLHGNPSERLAGALDALCAYRRNPHDDLRATGERAVAILARLLATGARGACARAHARLRWAPIATATADEPMAGLEAQARAIEAADPGVLEAAVFAGFPYADHDHLGASMCVSALAQGRGRAEAAACALAELARARHALGERRALAPDELAALIRQAGPGTVVVAEPSDNIGAGAHGDATGALRMLLDQWQDHSCLACMCDADAVAACASVPPGERALVALGGRGSRFDPLPLERDWLVVSRSHGRFRLSDPQGPLAALAGQDVDMGPCMVLAQRGVQVLVTSRPTPPWDLAQWTSQGLDPARARIIVVKSAVAHRRAYAPIAAAMASVETPGPCPSDLRAIRYRHASW